MLQRAQQNPGDRRMPVGTVSSTDPLKIKTDRDRIYKVRFSDETLVYRTVDAKMSDLEAGQKVRFIPIRGEGQKLRGAVITILPPE